MPNSNDSTRTSRWPTGTTFVMYCAGISLLLLVTYVITSGKLFEFSANDNGVSFKSVLSNGNVPADSVASRSEELKTRFERASLTQSSAPVTAPSLVDEAAVNVQPATQDHSFAGKWSGNGAIYLITQSGQNITLAEWTNSVMTSYGIGTVSGDEATLTVDNILYNSFPVTLTHDGGQLRLTAAGRSMQLQRAD